MHSLTPTVPTYFFLPHAFRYTIDDVTIRSRFFETATVPQSSTLDLLRFVMPPRKAPGRGNGAKSSGFVGSSSSGGRTSGVANSGSAVAGPGSKKQQAEQEDCSPWLKVRAKECVACSQNTHQIDRDSAADKPLHLEWKKWSKNAEGQAQPVGEECYRCFDVRRRNFPEYSMPELVEERSRHRAVDDKFAEFRGARVRGENSYSKADKLDVKTLVSKQSSDYVDRYEEGSFVELWVFARQRGLKFGKRQTRELTEYVQETLGMNVKSDDDGTVGVEILDHNKGQYRFRRGIRNEAVIEKQEQYDNKHLANDRFQMLAGKLHEKTSWAIEKNASGTGHVGNRSASPLRQDGEDFDDADLDAEDDAALSSVSKFSKAPASQQPLSSPAKSLEGEGESRARGETW